MDYEEIRKEVLRQVGEIDDLNELKRISAFINADDLYTLIAHNFSPKGLSKNDINFIVQTIIHKGNTLEEVNKFIYILKRSGFIRRYKFDSACSGPLNALIQGLENPVMDNLKYPLLTYKPAETSAVGATETFFVALGKNVIFDSKGDIAINGKSIEVKATQTRSAARMRGQKGFASPQSVWSVFYKQLVKIDSTINYNDPLPFNLNWNGLAKLNDTLSQNSSYQKTRALLKVLIEGLFTEIRTHNALSVNWFLKEVINKDGTLDIEKWKTHFTLLNFEYYKTIEGFEGLLLINISKERFVYIETVEDFWEMLEQDLIAISPNFKWNGGDSRDALAGIRAK